MVLFTPWAFGTTQDWAIHVMNVTGFLLGGILLSKWIICRQTGHQPMRWGQESETDDDGLIDLRKKDHFTSSLAILTGFILLYILIGAINKRATFIDWQRRFEYFDCLNWLPHSYDSTSTWRSFWMYSGLACFFWAARDWLMGKGGSGRRKRSHKHEAVSVQKGIGLPAEFAKRSLASEAGKTAEESQDLPGHRQGRELPPRLRLILWILCINGAVLALESILQRLSGTNKRLWISVPLFNDTAESQFGPYAYRANAASYFNLLWPVSLGFWLMLRQAAQRRTRIGSRIGTGNYLVLLPGAVLMAACPIISSTRGGAVVAVLSILIMMALLLRSLRHESFWLRAGASSLFVVIVLFSAALGLKQLALRFKTVFTDQMSQRTEIYQNSIPIARDFPVFGTGAGTFGSLYQLYRSDFDQAWNAYCHDDWLETRITFGWVGFSVILLMFGIVLARWFKADGILVSWELTATLWVALGGCLVHAKYDFPLQIYSILFLFLLLCAILFCVSKRSVSRA